MSLFRLDASIRARASHSRRIADIVQQEWRNAHPSDPVIHREVGLAPLPSDAWARAAFGRYMPEERRSPEQREAIALAATLTDELAAADALLFAVPLYNYGISQPLKAWADLVITDPRMATGGVPIIAGRPAVLVVVRGGAYEPDPLRQRWDHAVGWVRRILEDDWKLELRVLESDFPSVGVNTQLDEFTRLATQMRSEAAELARAHGQSLSTQLAA
jgi:FMN-dependent NADH-azoreductase